MKIDWQPAILWNIQDTLTEQDLWGGAGWRAQDGSCGGYAETCSISVRQLQGAGKSKRESCKSGNQFWSLCLIIVWVWWSNRNISKSMNGTPHIDEIQISRLHLSICLFIETEISVRDEVGHKNLDWDGGSDSVGYYISNGMIQKVQWAKEPNNEIKTCLLRWNRKWNQSEPRKKLWHSIMQSGNISIKV